MLNLPPIKAEIRDLVDHYGLSGIIKTLIAVAADKQEEVSTRWDGDPRAAAWESAKLELIRTLENLK